MIYIPEIYPDELVFSWFSRVFVHNGYLMCSYALRDIFNNRSNSPNVEFVGHLNQKMIEKITDMYDMQSLILNHTMFPYYARFIPLEQKKNALNHLCYDFDDVHHLFSVLPRKGNDKSLKYCPLCAKEDRELTGEAYWHRTHQIRGVSSCIKHNCKLIDFEVDVLSKPLYTLYPAETSVDDITIQEADAKRLEFDKYMTEVFLSQMALDDEALINVVLLNTMKNTKYISSFGRILFTKKLAEDINDFYCGIGTKDIATFYQIQRVLAGTNFDFQAVCQVAYFLGNTVNDLTKSKSIYIPINKNLKYRKKGEGYWKMLDDKTAPLLEKLAKETYYGNKTKRPERVSEKLICREMKLNQYSLENLPKCKSILEKYLESYEEFWARKIIWAYNKLIDENEKVTWTMLRKASGVKKEKIGKVVPFIYAHIDIEIADRITEILLE